MRPSTAFLLSFNTKVRALPAACLPPFDLHECLNFGPATPAIHVQTCISPAC